MTWSTEQVAERTGLSHRQLQNWDETGVVEPHRGKSKRREYSDVQLQELEILGKLKQKGFSLQMLRKLMPKIRRRLNNKGKVCLSLLLVAPDEVWRVRDSGQVLEILSGASMKRPVVLV